MAAENLTFLERLARGIHANSYEERCRSDEYHRSTHSGHTMTVEHGTPCGIFCVRRKCSCGWCGEWRKMLAAT